MCSPSSIKTEMERQKPLAQMNRLLIAFIFISNHLGFGIDLFDCSIQLDFEEFKRAIYFLMNIADQKVPSDIFLGIQGITHSFRFFFTQKQAEEQKQMVGSMSESVYCEIHLICSFSPTPCPLTTILSCVYAFSTTLVATLLIINLFFKGEFKVGRYRW